MKQLKQLDRLVLSSLLHAVLINAWAPSFLSVRLPQLRKQSILSISKSNKEDIVDSDEDWRDFRARLVRSENDNNIDSSSKKQLKRPDREKEDDDGHWAYETGEFVERGSIVISVPSSDAYLNDVDSLNNICYRKSIVLVMSVGPNFIQGIVLNRPTNIGVREGMQFVQPGHNEMFENEMGDCLGENCELDFDTNDGKQKQQSSSARWKVWFGGEVGGPYSEHPQVMCIHSIKAESALAVSDKVLPGIYVTSFSSAQDIIRAGNANPSDFWLFAGIFGVETTTFYSEMQNEGLWHIISADSGTVLEELNMLRCEEMEELDMKENCDIDADPRNAGLHTWEMLMQKIGLEKEAHESDDSFGDLMLREWATGALSFSVNEEQTTSMIMDPSSMLDEDVEFDLEEYDPASVMSSENEDTLSNQSQSAGIIGVIVRASSAKRSPYLLSDQGFHKSLVLIVQDGDDFSEGIILNHVTSKSLQLDLGDKVIDLPIRYGGPATYYSEYDEDDEEEDDEDYELPTIFLHSSESLQEAGVGVPVGKSRIYKCTKEEVINVFKLNIATVDDFMAVQGSSMWTKRGEHTGIIGDVEAGFFELVPRPKVHDVFTTLQKQEILTEDTLESNLSRSRLAWNIASNVKEEDTSKKESITVFGTGVDVTKLADEAAMRWVKVNLLQE